MKKVTVIALIFTTLILCMTGLASAYNLSSSCSFSEQVNKTGSADYAWRATNFKLTDSNINWSVINNASDIYLTDMLDNVVPYKVLEFNPIAKTATLWFNASPYNDTVMNYKIYSGCAGTPDDLSNPSEVFIFYDDFENGTDGWFSSIWENMTNTTDYVFDGNKSGFTQPNLLGSGSMYSTSPEWASQNETFIIEYAGLRNGTQGDDSGWWLTSGTGVPSSQADFNINWGYDASSYRDYPFDAGAYYDGSNYYPLWNDDGYGAGQWIKFKHIIKDDGNSSTTRDLYMKNSTETEYRSIANNTIPWSPLPITDVQYLAISSWNDQYSARNYIDNLLVYHDYDSNAESNTFSYIPSCTNFSDSMISIISPTPFSNISVNHLEFDILINTTGQNCYPDYYLEVGTFCNGGCIDGETKTGDVPDGIYSGMNETHHLFNWTGLVSKTYSISVNIYVPSDTQTFTVGTDNLYPSNPAYYVNIPTCSVCNETCSPCGGGCTATDLTNMFNGVTSFDSVVGDITGWNTSCITNMYALFEYSDFNQPIGSWDVSQVTDISYMFANGGHSGFNQNLSAWNTSKVTKMQGTFATINNFNGDITTWDTSSVTDMSYMFYASYDFNQPIGNWDVSKVTDMRWMFYVAFVFNQDLSLWNTSSVTNMDWMFRSANAFNGDIGAWDTSQVTSMNNIFTSLTLPVTTYDSILNGWASRTQQNAVPFDAGNSQYSIAGLSARNDTLIGTYGWSISDGGANFECVVDSDCGSCMKCSIGSCIVQSDAEDLKDDCSSGFNSCSNSYTLQGSNGFCDGAGACDLNSGYANVTEGNVCINGTDTNPASGVNCGVWKACEEYRTSADEYYVGYIGDGSGNCIDTDWQSKGTYWSTPLLYMISAK